MRRVRLTGERQPRGKPAGADERGGPSAPGWDGAQGPQAAAARHRATAEKKNKTPTTREANQHNYRSKATIETINIKKVERCKLHICICS